MSDVIVLDCEDCVYYKKEIINCEPCNDCYGFEHYKEIETNRTVVEIETNIIN